MGSRAPVPRPAERFAHTFVIGIAVVALAACGGGSNSNSGPAAPDDGPGGLPAAVSEQGELGRELVKRSGCTSCHNVDGTRAAGPTWKGLAGSTVALSDGTEVVADRDYLRRSITDPKADVREGYVDMMPTFSALSDDEVEAIVTYLEELDSCCPET